MKRYVARYLNHTLQEFFFIFTSSINGRFVFLKFKPFFVSLAYYPIQTICIFFGSHPRDACLICFGGSLKGSLFATVSAFKEPTVLLDFMEFICEHILSRLAEESGKYPSFQSYAILNTPHAVKG